MEKDKIIQYVLNEWAMRSPDGLASGYGGENNISALYDILWESELGKADILEVITGLFGEAEGEKQAEKPERKQRIQANAEYYLFRDKNNPRTIRVYNRDEQGFDYEDGEVYNHTPKMATLAKLKTDAPRNVAAAREALKLETDSKWRDMRYKKHVTAGNVERMKAAIESYVKKTRDTTAVEIFESKYDHYIKPEDAVKFYTGEADQGVKVKTLIDFIDDGTAKAPTGRGEMVFVYILKGMTSGGNKMMDLVIAEARGDLEKFGRDQGIEVKEAKNKVIGISLPTLKGYTQSDLYKAITELVNLIHKFGDKLYDSFVGIIDTSAEDETKKKEYKLEIEKFFNDPKSGEVSMTLIYALLVISSVVKASVPKTKDGVMDIDIGGEETEFDIKNVEDVKQDIATAKTKSNDNVTLNVVAKYSRSMPTEDMEAEMKKIKFFKEQITKEKLDEMVVGLMTNKYSKLLVVDKSATPDKRAVLYDLKTMNQLKFGYLGFGKLYLMLPGATSSDISKTTKAAGDEESNQS